MSGNYAITMAGNQIGSVQVRQEGLYWHIRCCCQLLGDVMYQLMLCHQGQPQCLGLLVPDGGHFVLEKRIPVKQVVGENIRFFLKPRHEKGNGEFIPIRAEHPLSCLASITRALLVKRNGEVGIMIQDEK